MTLGIVTDCTHYEATDGSVCTENHILLRQFEHLAAHFDKVIVACPFGAYDQQKVTTNYSSNKFRFHRLPLVGGNGVKDKLQLMTAVPTWYRAFKMLHGDCDVIYQRFPNNLNIPGFLFFWLQRKKVFATYTGTWKGYEGEAFSYKLQRWILRHPFRGPVWVYVDKNRNGSRIKPGFSPSYSEVEWEEETAQVTKRIESIKNEGLKVYRFITVGTLIDYKNQLAILEACLHLKQVDFPFKLTVVGDGPMRGDLEAFVKKHALEQCIHLVGKKNHVALRQLYRDHDFVVQAPLKEGFGKVPIEGFFHGAIPIINNVSLAGEMVGNEERGFLFDACKPKSLLETLLALPGKQHLLPQMIEQGRSYAKRQTLEAWAKEYFETVTAYYEA